ncbi:MAG: hypothetical protein GXP30_08065 [Verrucomicrobia bacterium]|nr:hypothetical protein [Verrucomicrobiota bacterium]
MSQARKTELNILRPDVEDWLLGTTSPEGRIAETAVDTSLKEVDTDICVLPVEVLNVCPLWLRATDDSMLEGAIRLQLEKRGILPEAGTGQLIAYKVVCRETSRALVNVMVLSTQKLAEQKIESIQAKSFSVSPLFYQLPANAMVVWRELGQDVVAFTRDGEVIHFQVLVAADDHSCALELHCLNTQLESEGVIHPLENILLTRSTTRERPSLAEKLDARMGVKPAIVGILSPKASIETVDLLPPVEQQRRQMASKRGRYKKLAMAFAAAYLVLLMSMGGRLYWGQQVVATDRERQEFLANKVADVRETKIKWQQIQSAVDPDEYPLEILSLCVEAINQRGVRLTEFGINSKGKIILAGDADSVPMALAFKSTLTSQPSLSRYDWSFPQPRNRKKGPGAVFKASGARNDYVTN